MDKPSIVTVLEHYGFDNVPDCGGWRPVRCAFHNDRHASASVYPDEGVFMCHVCYIKGDAYAVVMAREGISFPEAKTRVSLITGLTYGTGSTGDSAVSRTPVRSKLPAWTRNRKRKKVFA